MIDAADRRILAQLQAEGRMTNQDLAAATGLSTSACWRRVRALEEAGIIRGYAAQIDREKAGFAMSAVLQVSLERHDSEIVEQFVRRVRTRPEILECFATTGDADYYLRVVAPDIPAYTAFLDEFLFRLPGVRQVRSNVVLKEIKSAAVLPLD